jgi:hypothetical protein
LKIKSIAVLKKYFSIIIVLFPTLLFAILYGISVNDLNESNELIEIASSELNRLRILEQRTAIDSLKSNADEQFIMGNYEEALQLYAQLPDSEFAEIKEHRIKLAESITNEVTGNSESFLFREQQVQKLKEELILIENENLQLQFSYNDSIQNILKQLYIAIELNDNQSKELNSKKTGRLEFKSPKGNKVRYLGDLNSNMANGNGIGIWESGSFYEGEWKSNMRHGKGVFEWIGGEKYEGNYLKDLRSGFGIYHWKNGERYEGEWKNDQRNGQGTVYDKKGNIKITGIWENDELKSNGVKNGTP